jgi:hypothetical protein
LTFGEVGVCGVQKLSCGQTTTGRREKVCGVQKLSCGQTTTGSGPVSSASGRPWGGGKGRNEQTVVVSECLSPPERKMHRADDGLGGPSGQRCLRCGVEVVFQQPAEALAALNVFGGSGARCWWRREHRCQRDVTQALMRPFASTHAVVMSQVFAEQVAKVAFTENHEMVQTFAAGNRKGGTEKVSGTILLKNNGKVGNGKVAVCGV